MLHVHSRAHPSYLQGDELRQAVFSISLSQSFEIQIWPACK